MDEFLDGDGYTHPVGDDKPPAWLTLSLLALVLACIYAIACH
jgi:hypothetical protein